MSVAFKVVFVLVAVSTLASKLLLAFSALLLLASRFDFNLFPSIIFAVKSPDKVSPWLFRLPNSVLVVFAVLVTSSKDFFVAKAVVFDLSKFSLFALASVILLFNSLVVVLPSSILVFKPLKFSVAFWFSRLKSLFRVSDSVFVAFKSSKVLLASTFDLSSWSLISKAFFLQSARLFLTSIPSVIPTFKDASTSLASSRVLS